MSIDTQKFKHSLFKHSLYNSDYYQKNKERHNANTKRWRDSEKGKIYQKKLYEKRKSSPEYIEKIKKYKKGINHIFYQYQNSAKIRKLEFSLTLVQFNLFWKQECFYCGAVIDTIGLDRIDNNRGYIQDNVISCCTRCNYMKNNMSQDDFFKQCKKIVDRHLS